MIHLTPRRLSAAVFLAALGAVAILLVVKSPQSSKGAFNLNNLDCQGRVEPGVAGDVSVSDDDSYPVKYTFACNGPITGYNIQLQRGVDSFDTDAIVLDSAGNSPVTDSFSCNGDIPGAGFNCVGFYSGDYKTVSGQFYVGRPLYKKPLINPRLVVSTATVTSGKPVQALSGPFSLGHPHGVKKPKTKKHKK